MAPNWRASVQRGLSRVTGYRLVRTTGPARGRSRPPVHPDVDRLVSEPVFLLSSVRSGSTLLRAVLDSHSQIHSPHETHFRRLQVLPTTPPAIQALDSSGLSIVDVEHLLWDRLFKRSLALSGKRVLVEKTPSNVFAVDRLKTAWPQARFIFLLRHPLAIARSWHSADPRTRPMNKSIAHIRNYVEHLDPARQTTRASRCITSSSPPIQTPERRLCDYLTNPRC